MTEQFRRTNNKYYTNYNFDKTDKYKYINSTDIVDINSGDSNKLILNGSNNTASIISDKIDLSATNILIETQDEVRIKAGTYTIDAFTVQENYNSYKINIEKELEKDWVSTIEGYDNDEFTINLQIDSFNNVYMSGYSTSNNLTITNRTINLSNELVFDASYDILLDGGGEDAFLIKYDINGLIKWVSTIQGAFEFSKKLQIDSLNNVYMTGKSWDNLFKITNRTINTQSDTNQIVYDISLNGGGGDLFLIKYDLDGSINWVSTIKGDNNFEQPVNLQIDSLNNVYMSSFISHSNLLTITNGTIDTDLNQIDFDTSYDISLNGVGHDAFLIKYDLDGSINWVSTIKGTNQEHPVNLQIDSLNNVYMTGYSSSSPLTITNRTINMSNELVFDTSYNISLNASGFDAFLIKYDLDGSINWVSTIKGSNNENPVNLQIDSLNNVYMIGWSLSDQLKITNGTIDTQCDPNQIVFDTGYNISLNGGGVDAFLIKYNLDGSINWVSTIKGDNGDYPVNLQIDSLNNVYMTSYSYSYGDKLKITNGTINTQSDTNQIVFDVSYDILLNGDGYDFFLIKYDINGLIKLVSTIKGTTDDYPVNLQIDSLNNVYMTGTSLSDPLTITNRTINQSNELVFDTSYEIPNSGGGIYSFLIKNPLSESKPNQLNSGLTILPSQIDLTSTNILIDTQEAFSIKSDAFTLDASMVQQNSNIYKINAQEEVSIKSETIDLSSTNILIDAQKAVSIKSETIDLSSTNILIDAQEAVSIKSDAFTLDTSIVQQNSNIYKINVEKELEKDCWVSTIEGDSDDYPKNLQIDSSNNVYMTGYGMNNLLKITNGSINTQSDTNQIVFDASYDISLNGGGDDTFLIKYDLSGSINWVSTINGVSNEYPVNLQIDSLNNVYITGYSSSDLLKITNGSVNTESDTNQIVYDISLNGVGAYDAFLIKYDLSGSIKWVSTIEGDCNEEPINLQIDSLNNVYMTGYSGCDLLTITNRTINQSNQIVFVASYDISLNGGGSDDAFLIKYDRCGSIKWVSTIEGDSNDSPINLQIDSLNNVYMSGNSSSNPLKITNRTINPSNKLVFDTSYEILNSGSGDAFLIKYDRCGSINWVSTIKGANIDYPENLQIDSSNNVYMSGMGEGDLLTITNRTINPSNEIVFDISLNGGGSDAFLIKYDLSGSINWVSTIQGDSSDNPLNLQIDSLNNVYMNGFSESNQLTITNRTINTLSNELVFDASYDISLNGDGSFDAFLIKYDLDGSINWVSTIQGVSSEYPEKLQIDSLNNVYMSGSSESDLLKITNRTINTESNQIVFDASYDILLNGDSSDLFLIKYDLSGSIQLVSTIKGAYDWPEHLKIDSLNNVYMTGKSLSDPLTITNRTINQSNELVFDTSYEIPNSGGDIYSFLIKNPLYTNQLNSGLTILPSQIDLTSTNILIDAQEVVSIKSETIDLTSQKTKIEPVKYGTNNNNLKWVSTIQGDSNEYPANLQIDSSNNVYMTGYSGSDPLTITNGKIDTVLNQIVFDASYDISLNYGGTDAFLIKYDLDGSIIWVSTIKGTSNDYPVNLQIDSLNNVYMSGSSQGTQLKITNITIDTVSKQIVSNTSYDIPIPINGVGFFGKLNAFLIKYDISGSIKWVSTIRGKRDDYLVNLQIDSLNNVYMSGYSYGDKLTITNRTIDTDSNELVFNASYDISLNDGGGNSDAFLIKYDLYGSINWVSTIRGILDDIPKNLQINSLNNVYMTGCCKFNQLKITNITIDTDSKQIVSNTSYDIPINGEGFTTNFNAFLIKYDLSGSINWVSTIGGKSDDYLVNLQIDSLNNVYMSGYSYSDKLTITNGSINTQLTQIDFGASYEIQLNDGGGNNDAFLIKYDLDGSINWVSTIRGNFDDNPKNLQIDSSNNVYMTGNISSEKLTLTKGSINTNNTNQIVFDMSYDITLNGGVSGGVPGYDTCLIKYDINGSINWVSTIQITKFSQPIKLQIDRLNNVYITGSSPSDKLKITNGSINTSNNNTNQIVFDMSYDISLNGDDNDGFLIKYDLDGSINWVSTIKGPASQQPVNLQIDSLNNVYMTGTSSSNPLTITNRTINLSNELVFDTSYEIPNSGSGDDNAFLIKYQPSDLYIDETPNNSTLSILPNQVNIDCDEINYSSNILSGYKSRIITKQSFSSINTTYMGFSNQDKNNCWGDVATYTTTETETETLTRGQIVTLDVDNNNYIKVKKISTNSDYPIGVTLNSPDIDGVIDICTGGYVIVNGSVDLNTGKIIYIDLSGNITGSIASSNYKIGCYVKRVTNNNHIIYFNNK